MISDHVILIDGNSIAHASHNATKLTVGTMQVQAVFGFLKTIRALRQGLPGSVELWVLWDGRAQFRIDLFPEYKGNRAAMNPEQLLDKEAFKRQIPYIEQSLKALGIKQFRCQGLEADDLAAHFVRILEKAGKKVTLLSGDKDWLQFVSELTSWFDPIRDRRCDTGNFFQFTGYMNTRAFVEGKALQGDSSDNIDGIPKMGEKTAALFVAQWKSVENFFAAVDAGTYTPATRKSKNATSLHPEEFLASPEGRAIFHRNMKLMDLSQSPLPTGLTVVSEPPNVDKFMFICERLAFASIIRGAHAFLDTFNLKPPAYLAKPATA